MKYSGIKTDSKLRFLKCPVCGNDEFSSDAAFCKVCGSSVYNYCQDLFDEGGYKISAGCKRINPGNSRFCEFCGNPTLLNKYLTNWEEEKLHLQKYGGEDEADDFLIEDTKSMFKKDDDFDNKDDELTDTFEELATAKK